MTEQPLAVSLQGISKQFPGVLANDNVNFELRQGEIHALLGENGAGKSTLMNILGGLYRPDTGTIQINGQPAILHSPRDAIKLGIGMVHQHFMLVPSQTVTENILLGLDKPRFFMRLGDYHQKIAALGEQYGLQVDPRAHIWQLSVGEQQRVELLKMLYRGADILIMDEPTAVLAPSEIQELFKTLKNMVSLGKSIVFISHKLQEIQAIADRVTVLQRGRVTASGVATAGISRAELARLMVGREVLFHLERVAREPGSELLRVENLSADNDRGLPALRQISFSVRAGEIVGIAGVAGNGQSELAQVITGLRRCNSGRVTINGKEVSNRPAWAAIKAGIAHIPEDRTGVGSAPNLNITENVIMKSYDRPPMATGLAINYPAARNHAISLKNQYNIAAPTVETQARLLSGGNLQKVILAREISAGPQITIAVQPTRGLDVGAVEGVQHLLLAQREAGSAILLISEELEEIIALSDRVLVIYEGRIMGEVNDGDIAKIGLLMAGG